MTATDVLTVTGGVVVILGAAARIPAAAAELVRAFIPLVQAVKELCAAIRPSMPVKAAPTIPGELVRDGGETKSAGQIQELPVIPDNPATTVGRSTRRTPDTRPRQPAMTVTTQFSTRLGCPIVRRSPND